MQTNPAMVIYKIVLGSFFRRKCVSHAWGDKRCTYDSINSFFLLKSKIGATYNDWYLFPEGYLTRQWSYCDKITTHMATSCRVVFLSATLHISFECLCLICNCFCSFWMTLYGFHLINLINRRKTNNFNKWTALFSCIYVALPKPISALLLQR